MRLFTSEAEKVELDTHLLQGLEAVIASTVNRGLADTDYSAVYDGIIEPNNWFHLILVTKWQSGGHIDKF